MGALAESSEEKRASIPGGRTVAKQLLLRGVEEVRLLSREEAKLGGVRLAIDAFRPRFYLRDARLASFTERRLGACSS